MEPCLSTGLHNLSSIGAYSFRHLGLRLTVHYLLRLCKHRSEKARIPLPASISKQWQIKMKGCLLLAPSWSPGQSSTPMLFFGWGWGCSPCCSSPSFRRVHRLLPLLYEVKSVLLLGLHADVPDSNVIFLHGGILTEVRRHVVAMGRQYFFSRDHYDVDVYTWASTNPSDYWNT